MMNLSEDRILDFLDGRLATGDEEELLHTLAVSPERRQVLRAHIRLRELTSNLARQERFTVPENVTDGLFAKLEEAGFNAPPVPESMLGAGKFVPESFAVPAGVGAAGVGALASAIGSGWRFGMMGIVAASVMSFVLGAGAYYVFGSSLGLRTHSQEMAMLNHRSQPAHVAHSVTPQAAPTEMAALQAAPAEMAAVQDNASATAVQSSADIAKHSAIRNALATNNAGAQAVGPIAFIGPIYANVAGQSIAPKPVLNDDIAQTENMSAIGLTAPRDVHYKLAKDKLRFLSDPSQIWPNAIAQPYSIDRGIISVRYGLGASPTLGSNIGNSNAPVSTMSEFRIGMTTWNYMLWRASIGQMTSFERAATVATTPSGTTVITTPENNSAVTTTLIGLEAGLTLDPIGVPVDALVGFMWSGGPQSDLVNGTNYAENSPFYGRASIMAHFEPWKLMEISAGFEGILYTHYLGGSIAAISSSFNPQTYAPKLSGVTSETCGLVGPAIEVGWHF